MQNLFEVEPKSGSLVRKIRLQSDPSIDIGGGLLKVFPNIEKLRIGTSSHLPLVPSANSLTSRQRTLSQKDLVNQISDFKDRAQIWEAVNYPNTTREKIKVIDAVIQRREEIEEKKKRRRARKAETMFIPAIQRIKKSLSTNITNQFRKSVSDVNFDDITCRDLRTSQETKATRSSFQSPMEKFAKEMKEESRDSDSSEESVKLVFPIEESPILKMRSCISMPLNVAISARSSPIHSLRVSNVYPFTTEEQKQFGKQDLMASSLRQRLGRLSTREGVSPDISPTASVISRVMKAAKNVENSSSPSTITNPTPSKTVNSKDRPKDDIYQIAGRKFEKDLYRFLLTNRNTEDSRAMITKSPIKRRRMRKIEETAFTQYEQFTNNRENLDYYLNNLLKTKISKLKKEEEKIIQGSPKKAQQLPLQYQVVVKTSRTSRVGQRSSSFVRKTDPQDSLPFKAHKMKSIERRDQDRLSHIERYS